MAAAAAAKISIAGAIEILKKLSSIPEEEIKLILCMKKEFIKLKETFPMIQAVLRDAEIRQEKDGRIRLCLKRIKDVAYEVDDLLDEFEYEDMRRRIEVPNSKMEEVCDFFSPKNPIVFCTMMAHKIKNINDKLDKIQKDMKMFNFEIGEVSDHFKNDMDRATDASIDSSQIFGREKEKSMLIDMLIQSSSNEEVFSVIPIVGIGGLGKTTLAKMLYNDESVVKHFEKKMWVCVSDNFEVSRLRKEMLECLTGVNSNLSYPQAIQNSLDDNLRGRRFLLVLDDVWNCSHEKWDKFRASLVIGAKGSKVVVTTRNQKFELIMGTLPPLYLTGLSEKESWDLFKIKAFGNGVTMNPKVVKMAEGLMGKCKGVPLAIKSLSALIHSEWNENEWLSIQQGAEIWKESEVEDEKNGILPVLKLSYDHLSSPLKQCFAYCSIFPKDYKIHKKTLIQLWMAEGLLQSPSSSSSSASTSSTTLMMEDIGDKYFRSLVRSCFLQDVERGEYGEEVECKMHDLMHDLAQLITGNDCTIVEDFSKVQPNLETQYLSLVGEETRVPETFYMMKKLRAHLCLDKYSFNWRLHHISDDRFFNFRSLRVLGLNNVGIHSLPSSIEKLKHLRYLDLTGNRFPTFPESITKLYNLQTLKMHDGWYRSWRWLPKGITKMTKLRHLEVGDGVRYPKGIGQLTNLQTLEYFEASSEGEGDDTEVAAGIEELGDLQQLGGSLRLFNLRCLKDDVIAANLKEKPRLKELRLIWTPFDPEIFNEDMTKPPVSTVDHDDLGNSLLESLQPHPNLIFLQISYFTGTKTPSWMSGSSYLSSLKHLRLNSCFNVKSLYLEGLSSLQWLEIKSCKGLTSLRLLKGLTALNSIKLLDCPNLVSIRAPDENGKPDLVNLKTLEIIDCVSLATLPDGFFSLLTSLNTLQERNCTNLRNIPESIGYLSSLRELAIEYCPAFVTLSSLQHLSSLQQLNICYFPELVTLLESLGDISSLQHLSIRKCPNLVTLPNRLGDLSSLQQLTIYYCLELVTLPECLGDLSLLRHLSISECPSLVTLPKRLGDLSSLQQLEIHHCPGLVTLPECLGDLSSLQQLEIHHCPGLVTLPECLGDLSSLQQLEIHHCPGLVTLPECLGDLSSLRLLEIHHCPGLVTLPECLGDLSLLQNLSITEFPSLVTLPKRLGDLSSLRRLEIRHCPGLATLPECLGDLSLLQNLSITEFPSLVTLPKRLGDLSSLRWLKIHHCSGLVTLPECLGDLSLLEHLSISGCPSLVTLPKRLGDLSLLQRLEIDHCSGLVTLPERLQNLLALESLVISSCPLLEALPEGLGNLSSLSYLSIGDCCELTALPESLGNSSSLEQLWISNCQKLRSLPYLRLKLSLVRHCPLLRGRYDLYDDW